MNKKFLSAILFGALMVTSTGTFVSCKDYDDDIENLQTQIDKNSSAIAELQKLVGQGKWVSSISSIENGFTVTMSDGSSHQIKGINGKDGANGKDGKNGTEWTIGEDGFWYVDGAKTENVAVAKDGKNGVTAPSPSIGADGNWIVYNWDEAKGEFVAEATEIPAAGTAAYAVEADGVYTLHIADENGEYQEIALPATCDSFVVSSPAPKDVAVLVEQATWGTTGRVKAEYDVLVKAFPEIADIKKGAELTQGGELPLLINPTNVDLDDNYTFSLVDMKGNVADIELANPTQGISSDWTINWFGTMSRSAEAEGGLWTLEATPAYDKKKGYASIENGALVVTNAKGISSRTAFAYHVNVDEVASVDVVVTSDPQAEISEAIDVLAAEHGANKDAAIFTLENEYYGKYVLETTSAIQTEKYDITIEGSKVMIGEMPANETEIIVKLKLTALGLNGSTDAEIVELKVVQPIAAIELPAKEVTLDAEAQEVRWSVEEDLDMSAVEFENFLSTKNVKFAVTREADKNKDGENEKYVTYYEDIIFYNAKGKPTKYSNESWNNGEAVTFGFDVVATMRASAKLEGYTAERWMPATYTVSLVSKKLNTVIYKAETELTVNNPTTTAIALIPEFVEDGVLQAVGTVSGSTITYDFATGLKFDEDIVTIKRYVDMDHYEYCEAYSEVYGEKITVDPEELASVKWINNEGKLEINSYDADKAEENPAEYGQLEQVRNIQATYILFGNEQNIQTFDFQVVVKSAVYSEAPTEVVTIPAASLNLVLTDNTDDKIDQTTANIAKIAEAVLAYGPKAGKEYVLFNVAAYTENFTAKNYSQLAYKVLEHSNGNKFVADKDDKYVPIEIEDLRFFGYSADDVLAVQQGKKEFYFAYERQDENPSWQSLYNTISGYYVTIDGKKQYVLAETEGAKGSLELNTTVYNKLVEAKNEVAVKNIDMFIKYSDKAGVKTVTGTKNVPAKYVDSTLLKKEAEIVAVDAAEAAKFVSINGKSIKAQLGTGVEMTAEKKEVAFKLVINDAWGKTMEVPFTITIAEHN